MPLRYLLEDGVIRTAPCEPYGWFLVCVSDRSFLTVLMACFYYVPYALAIAIFIALIIRRTTTMLLALIWIILLAVLNEGILKQIIKQPRPHDSCDCTCVQPKVIISKKKTTKNINPTFRKQRRKTCLLPISTTTITRAVRLIAFNYRYGMPSGHTVISMGFLVWIVLEALFAEPMERFRKRNGLVRAYPVFLAFVRDEYASRLLR